jgi:hypothetical protein
MAALTRYAEIPAPITQPREPFNGELTRRGLEEETNRQSLFHQSHTRAKVLRRYYGASKPVDGLHRFRTAQNGGETMERTLRGVTKLMSLGQEIAPHLPFLRRYARLTGTQAHGDAFVRAALEAIVAKPTSSLGMSIRAWTLPTFHAIWSSANVEEGEERRLVMPGQKACAGAACAYHALSARHCC